MTVVETLHREQAEKIIMKAEENLQSYSIPEAEMSRFIMMIIRYIKNDCSEV